MIGLLEPLKVTFRASHSGNLVKAEIRGFLSVAASSPVISHPEAFVKAVEESLKQALGLDFYGSSHLHPDLWNMEPHSPLR